MSSSWHIPWASLCFMVQPALPQLSSTSTMCTPSCMQPWLHTRTFHKQDKITISLPLLCYNNMLHYTGMWLDEVKKIWKGVPPSHWGIWGASPRKICKFLDANHDIWWHLASLIRSWHTACTKRKLHTTLHTFRIKSPSLSLVTVNFSLQPFLPPSISDTFVYLLTLNTSLNLSNMYIPAARHHRKMKENSTNFSLTSGRNTQHAMPVRCTYGSMASHPDFNKNGCGDWLVTVICPGVRHADCQ